ncbi:MAG TPA: hypothetical protein VI279_03860 [Rhodocyclaceae bacterium]
MTHEERGGLSNGIWLCSTCADIVDRDIGRFPAMLLHEWKVKAEAVAEDERGKRIPSERELSVYKARALGDIVTSESVGQLVAGVHQVAVQELEKLDPRFSATICVGSDGRPIISLDARQNVPCQFLIPAEKAKEFEQKFFDLNSHGRTLEIEAGGIEIEGMPLLKGPFPSASRLVIESTARKPFLHRLFWLDVDSGKQKTAEFVGEAVAGEKTILLKGELFGGLYKVEYQLPLQADGKLSININSSISFQTWDGLSVQSLPYLDQLLSLCEAIGHGKRLSSCLEIAGREIVETEALQLLTEADALSMAATLAHLKRIRDLSRLLAIDVPFSIGEVSSDDFEYVTNIWYWLCGKKHGASSDSLAVSLQITPTTSGEAEELRKHIRNELPTALMCQLQPNRPLPLLKIAVPIGPINFTWAKALLKPKRGQRAIRKGRSVDIELLPQADSDWSATLDSSETLVAGENSCDACMQSK